MALNGCGPTALSMVICGLTGDGTATPYTVAQYAQDGSAAVLAVQAGNDMVLTTDFETQIPQVIAAVEDGTIPMEQIDQSVARVLSWKYDLGLLGY